MTDAGSKLTILEFQAFADFINQVSGIQFSREKAYLIEQRLDPILKEERLSSYRALLDRIRAPQGFLLRDKVIMALTTNETLFFRDGHPFMTFQECILPELGQRILERREKTPSRKGSRVDLWCAGASTGQEPYSLAMLIFEYVERNRWRNIHREDFSVLATDISTDVLATAMRGGYRDFEVDRGLDLGRRNRFFTRVDDQWMIKDFIRQMITFRKVNLKEPFSHVGGMDVIFCRNVFIYFDEQTKQQILQGFHRLLAPDGILVLGASETMGIKNKLFGNERYKETVLYRKINEQG